MKLVETLNAGLPTEHQVLVTASGQDILAKLVALPANIKGDILSGDFDLGAFANESLELAIEAAAVDPVKAKSLKLKVFLSLMVVLAVVLLSSLGMAITTAYRTGQPMDTAAIESSFKLIVQLLGILIGAA